MEKFEFDTNQYIDYVLAQANACLNKCEIYSTPEKRKGLLTDVERSIEAKSNLFEIFKNHPAHNGKGQLVLPMEVIRPIDSNIIFEFAEYIRILAKEIYLSEEVTIDGYTYGKTTEEISRIERYRTAVNYMHIDYDKVIIDGKSMTEYAKEIEYLEKIQRKFIYGNNYKQINGKYVNHENAEKNRKISVLAYAIENTVGPHLEEGYIIKNLIKEFPQCQAREGAKITRVVQKCLKQSGLYDYAMETQKEKFNKQYSRYCDGVNPIKVIKWSVLSINFVDFLTMSHGDSWTSCLNTDCDNKFTRGSYSNGFNSRRTLDYALDPSTMVFYTVDEDYEGDDWELQPKTTRQLFHFGNGKLIQARLYPQDDISRREIYTQYRNVVEKLLSDCLGEANLWSAPERGTISPSGKIFCTPYEDNCTADFIDFSTYACHGGEERDFQSEVNYVYLKGNNNSDMSSVPMQIGATDAVCIYCGDNFEEDYTKSIMCYDCRWLKGGKNYG